MALGRPLGPYEVNVLEGRFLRLGWKRVVMVFEWHCIMIGKAVAVAWGNWSDEGHVGVRGCRAVEGKVEWELGFGNS